MRAFTVRSGERRAEFGKYEYEIKFGNVLCQWQLL